MTALPSSTTAPRVYTAHATTTAIFGRVQASVRSHQLTVDGPVRNGAPGEAPTPGELVLVAVASCGAEVLQVLARDAGVALSGVSVTAQGTIDMDQQPHAEVTVFSSVELEIVLRDATSGQAAELVAGFQRRCPVYGSLAVASGRIAVHHRVEPSEVVAREAAPAV
jgi:uncharacterized OsmC-like protein